MRKLDRFFDCMNVRSYNECIYKRKPDLRPYRKLDDPRLTVNIELCACMHDIIIIVCMQWLESDFLSYFKEWEDSVANEEEKAKMMIARETRTGLKFTGNSCYMHALDSISPSTPAWFSFNTVKSMIGLIRYCLGVDGVQCVLTEHLCQDPLEAFFGRHRMSCGWNDNPNVHTFLHNTVSLRVQGSAAMQPFRGNTRRKRRDPIPVDNTPLPKRARSNIVK